MSHLIFNTRRRRRLIDQFRGALDESVRVMLEAGPEGRLICDLDGRVVCANAALARFLGSKAELLPGRPAAAIFAREKRDEAWRELFQVMTGEASERSFVTLLDGDGAPMVEVAPTRLLEADGSISGLLVRCADVTVQRHLEMQLAQAQKLQAVGQLAGGIAHDFNNLLTAMLGGAEEILARRDLHPAVREDVEQIKNSADRGAALVRQLLAFGRQQTLQPRVVDINKAITDISALLRRLLGSKVRLDLDLEHPGRRVRVDPVQLDQVLVNLSVNARDAMIDNPAERAPQLTLRSSHALLLRPLVRGQETIPPGRYVVIEVQDNGAGIPPAVLPRIFDPFFTTKRERGGNGLGLSTVHGIVRQSEGFLAVESERGAGTCFRIYLPRHEGKAEIDAAAEPAAIAETRSGGAARVVLIVEDEPEVRRLAVRQFANHGWTVIQAEDGLDARAKLAGDPPLDLVISDVVMPGVDGPSLVRELRGLRPALPAILVSGYADENLRRELARQDIVFMPKPYSLKGLIEAAETTLKETTLKV